MAQKATLLMVDSITIIRVKCQIRNTVPGSRHVTPPLVAVFYAAYTIHRNEPERPFSHIAVVAQFT